MGSVDVIMASAEDQQVILDERPVSIENTSAPQPPEANQQKVEATPQVKVDAPTKGVNVEATPSI